MTYETFMDIFENVTVYNVMPMKPVNIHSKENVIFTKTQCLFRRKSF